MKSDRIIDVGEFGEIDETIEISSEELIESPKPTQPAQPLALQAEKYEDVFLPSLSIEQARIRFEMMQRAGTELLIEGRDYGRIPGTDGNTLLLAGAEKLAAFYGLTVHVYQTQAIRERINRFWLYEHKATVSKGGVVIAECIGECNSEEDCWKVWVKQPAAPDRETQSLMVAEKRGRWSEWNGNREWSEKRDHPNPLTLLNNGNKRSQKRAYVGAVRKALGISGLFAKLLK